MSLPSTVRAKARRIKAILDSQQNRYRMDSPPAQAVGSRRRAWSGANAAPESPTTLEVKSEFTRKGARGDEMGAAERRKEEVVQHHLIGEVNDGKAQAPLVAVTAVKQTVVADRQVEQMPPPNTNVTDRASCLGARRILMPESSPDGYQQDRYGSSSKA